MRFKVGDHVKASAVLRAVCDSRLMLDDSIYEFVARGGLVAHVESSSRGQLVFIRVGGGISGAPMHDVELRGDMLVMDVELTILDGAIRDD